MEEDERLRTVTVVEEASTTNDFRNFNAERETEQQQEEISLTDIHRQVLLRIEPQPPPASTASQQRQEESTEYLQYRLATLKRKRLFLESELARKRASLTTVSEELLQNHQQQQQSTRAHDHHHHHHHNTDNNEFLVAQQRIALRLKRRIAGSHRLAGISVVPCDDNSNELGVRLDICVAGCYVNRHYLFFQKVVDNTTQETMNQDDEQLDGQSTPAPQHRLKLIQHTLPHGVLAALNHEHSTITAPPLLNQSLDELQRYIGRAHDACYHYAVRQDAVDYLRTMQQEKSDGTTVVVTNVDCSTELDVVSFQLSLTNGEEEQIIVCILLQYTNPFSSLPTKVKVSRVETTTTPAAAVAPTATNTHGRAAAAAQDHVLVQVSSDEEDDIDSTSILSRIRDAFQTSGVREAIQTVASLPP